MMDAQVSTFSFLTFLLSYFLSYFLGFLLACCFAFRCCLGELMGVCSRGLFSLQTQTDLDFPVIPATLAGDAAAVRALIAEGHDVNAVDLRGMTPLALAAFKRCA